MSYTEEQIECIADHLRSAGFEFDSFHWNNDKFALVADCVSEALGLELPE